MEHIEQRLSWAEALIIGGMDKVSKPVLERLEGDLEALMSLPPDASEEAVRRVLEGWRR